MKIPTADVKFTNENQFTAEEKSRQQEPLKPSQESEVNDTNHERPEISDANENHDETSCREVEVSDHTDVGGSLDLAMSDSEFENQVESVKRRFVDRSEKYNIPQLERLYTRIMKGIFEIKDREIRDNPKATILRFLQKFVEDDANF